MKTIVAILLLCLLSADAQAGPLRRLIQRRRASAVHSCNPYPCLNVWYEVPMEITHSSDDDFPPPPPPANDDLEPYLKPLPGETFQSWRWSDDNGKPLKYWQFKRHTGIPRV